MKILIIGNGIAGITAAVEIRKRSKSAEIIVISEESADFYSRPALMYIYMRQMKFSDTVPYEKKFWKKNRIHLLQKRVEKVNYDQKQLLCSDGSTHSYDKLVLATGSRGNRFGWPGENLPGVTCFTNLSELEDLEKRTIHPEKTGRAIVVGGGLIGIEAAEIFHHRGIPVTFLVREPHYWSIALSAEEGDMVAEEIRDHGIDLRLNTELKSIARSGERLQVTTSAGDVLNAGVVVLAAGVSPSIDFLRGDRLRTARGILVDAQLRTSEPDVYACGDCAELDPRGSGKGSVEALWYTGKMQGEIVARNICGENTEYERGIWYNSAKFFSIDFHTYGLVSTDAGEKEFFRRVPGKRKSLRIVHDGRKVLGFNLLGIRYRDAVCRRFIAEERSPEYVMEHLAEANFDQEFSDRHEDFFRAEFFAVGGAV